MVKCKACGNDMPFELIEGTTTYEFVCDECKRQSRLALQTHEWDFNGLFWQAQHDAGLPDDRAS